MFIIKTSFDRDIIGFEARDESKYLEDITNTSLYEIKKKSYIFSRQVFEKEFLESKAQKDILAIGHRENGKPYLLINNKMTSYDLSLSHKNNFICVGISKSPYRIGVDVEQLDQNVEKKFAGFFLNDREINLLKSEQDVLIFWSLKESFFKAAGFFLPFKELQITRISENITYSFSSQLKARLLKENLVFVASSFYQEENFIVTYTLLQS
jgi:phosphopantetheinyl transferase